MLQYDFRNPAPQIPPSCMQKIACRDIPLVVRVTKLVAFLLIHDPTTLGSSVTISPLFSFLNLLAGYKRRELLEYL